MAGPTMSAIEDLRATIARLRAPGGCPWDQEQTHQSLARCLIDECSELLDTIDRMDMPHMREELGDVLIQVIFHAQLAEEKGLFDLEAVAREVNEKLVRRHPHVFGENKLGTSDEVLKQWEAIKLEEKKKQGKTESGLFKGLPPQLPALMYAEASWKQIEKKNLALSSGELAAAVREKEASLSDEGLGRQLFVLAAAARKNGLDPEGALRRFTSSVIADAQTCAQRPSGNS